MPAELRSQARPWEAPPRLDLRNAHEHARLLFRIQRDGRSLVVLDQRQARAFRETRTRLDSAVNDAAVGNLHGTQR